MRMRAHGPTPPSNDTNDALPTPPPSHLLIGGRVPVRVEENDAIGSHPASGDGVTASIVTFIGTSLCTQKKHSTQAKKVVVPATPRVYFISASHTVQAPTERDAR